MEVTPDHIEQVSATVDAAMINIREQLDIWIGLITGAMQKVRDDPVLTRKEVTEGVRELARTRQILLHERDRLLETFKQEVGIVHDTLIDFETERIAIAGKLDRLRAAGETDDISG